ncbi:glycoside hydrolase family 97 C-terminal domain-containing protein, partial [Umezakia ovalisporum]|uniref:glycoside hydrolase family 97 C-terminal domain-containing protein n=1 Tax=Umezakia ovalisporum TaxID=75695 RepID=UPI0039C68F39
DAPQAYRKEPEMLEFLKQVPTVWDETRVLLAKFGESLIIARRKDDIWFVAGMCAEKPQNLSFNLPFTKSRELKATVWRDGLNASKYPADFIKEELAFNRETLNNISLVRGGGFVMIVSPKKQ